MLTLFGVALLYAGLYKWAGSSLGTHHDFGGAVPARVDVGTTGSVYSRPTPRLR